MFPAFTLEDLKIQLIKEALSTTGAPTEVKLFKQNWYPAFKKRERDANNKNIIFCTSLLNLVYHQIEERSNSKRRCPVNCKI